MSLSLQFVADNALPAVIVAGYLAYEIRWGRLSTLANKLDEIIIAVVALAKENDDIDEDAVADRLNGSSPDDLRIESDHE